MTEQLKGNGINQLILDPSSKTLVQGIEDQTILRRAALKQENRALGYPTMAFPCDLTGDSTEEILCAGAFVARYAGIIVVSNPAEQFILPLLVQRMDNYTDPRKLRTVEGKIYEINDPGEDAHVLVTTNFVPTYM